MATRCSSETSNEKSFLLLVSAITTPMMSASGLVMPERKRGFWLRMAARSVLPERGIPEMKWNLRADFATWGTAGMGSLSCYRPNRGVRRMISGPGGRAVILATVRPESMNRFLRSGRPALDGAGDAPRWNVPSSHFDHGRRRSRRREMRRQSNGFPGTQRDVIVAPQDRQHGLAVRGSLDRHVLEQRHGFGGWGYRQRDRGDVLGSLVPHRYVDVARRSRQGLQWGQVRISRHRR